MIAGVKQRKMSNKSHLLQAALSNFHSVITNAWILS